ncbi:MAG: hypothetical protein AAFV62_11645, partial [Pseudomonadota bacterium]
MSEFKRSDEAEDLLAFLSRAHGATHGAANGADPDAGPDSSLADGPSPDEEAAGGSYVGVDLVACLPTLLAGLGWQGGLRRVHDAMPFAPDAIHEVDIINAMADLGYSSHALPMRLCDVERRLLPCLFVPAGGGDASAPDDTSMPAEAQKSAMVLFDGEDGTPHLLIGSTGETIPFNTESPVAKIRGKAHIFRTLSSKNEAAARAATGWGWFMTRLTRFRSHFLHIFLTSAAINLIALATPLFVMTIYDSVIGARSEETWRYLLLGIMLALGVEVMLRYLRLCSVSWLSARLDNVVSNAIFE